MRRSETVRRSYCPDYLATSARGLFGKFYSTLADGSHIDIVAGNGIFVDGSTEAEGATSDVRMQTAIGPITIEDVTAGRDVALDSEGTKGPSASRKRDRRRRYRAQFGGLDRDDHLGPRRRRHRDPRRPRDGHP